MFTKLVKDGDATFGDRDVQPFIQGMVSLRACGGLFLFDLDLSFHLTILSSYLLSLVVGVYRFLSLFYRSHSSPSQNS